jgi:lipoprotein-releasing system permease protein
LSFRLTIARRYLASPRRVTLVSVISALSVAGVALGVTALIVVLSVMNGFFDVVRDLLVSFDPHVRIEAVEGRRIDNPDSLLAIAAEIDGVESVAAYVEGKALLTYDGAPGSTQVVVVRGVDTGALAGASGDARLADAVTSGRFDVGAASEHEPPGIVVGSSLSMQLGLYPGIEGAGGSRLGLLSAQGLERLLTQPLGLPPQQAFTVRGVYELQPAYDRTNVFVGIAEAQRLFRMPGQVTGVELRLFDLDRAGSVQAALERRLDPERYRVSTWYDLQRALYDVMQLEKWGASFILMLIIVVAAFNIVGSLTMIVIEKRRDLGALRAMGATRRDIRKIFLIEGLLVGCVGAGIGLVLGLGLALLQQATGFVPLAQAEAFIIDAYPVSIRVIDVTLITLVAVGLCVVAAIYPASRASAVEPAQAVRGSG